MNIPKASKVVAGGGVFVFVFFTWVMCAAASLGDEDLPEHAATA